MKVGVFGGTFNPIHNSHLYLADEFASRLGLDRMLLIPTNTPPHKPADGLASTEDRLAMCRLAVEERPSFAVSDCEAVRPGRSYTYRTLEQLRMEFSSGQLYFLMGADMFLTVQSWRYPERIYKAAILCAAARQPGELNELKAQKDRLEAEGARCLIQEIPPKPLSSTQVREAAGLGLDIRLMVSAAVADYIDAHGLYGRNDEYSGSI